MIHDNINIIINKLHDAVLCGRTSPCLVAVTKGQDDLGIDAALSAGQRVFGENRVQEAISHWSARRTAYPDLELHLIGPLQTNKVAEAVALFDIIQTVDRERLVDALVDEMARQKRSLPCLIQVNIGEEPQKSGVLPADLPDLLAYAREKGLNVVGLMAIPPVNEAPGPYFALLSKLAKRHGLAEVSMGMSGDYALAAQMGATYVRVGSAIFGERTQ